MGFYAVGGRQDNELFGEISHKDKWFSFHLLLRSSKTILVLVITLINEALIIHQDIFEGSLPYSQHQCPPYS